MPRPARLDAPWNLAPCYIARRIIDQRRIVDDIADRKNFVKRMGELASGKQNHDLCLGADDRSTATGPWGRTQPSGSPIKGRVKKKTPPRKKERAVFALTLSQFSTRSIAVVYFILFRARYFSLWFA